MKPSAPAVGPGDALLPPMLRDLEVVAAALVTRDGLLRDSNRGFRRLFSDCGDDVRDLFVNPRFDQLAARARGSTTGVVYRGILNLGDGAARTLSLRGRVYGTDGDLLLVAEHDVAQLETAVVELYGLVDELAHAQRPGVRAPAPEPAPRPAAPAEQAARRQLMGVATLAHEIRNAAHVVSLALKVARRDPARLGRSLDTAERQLVQLERLAGDLMDASRISQGRLSLHTERLNLVEVVRHAADGARAALEQAGHELSCELPAVPVVVRGDSGRLLQVIGNLLDNAIKYTPPGGHIGLQLTAGAAGAELVVRDDGAGIPPEKLDSVFDTFEQLGRSGGSGGVGIGLSLARSLVELHGGTLRAVSEGPGRGSEFRLWLPLAADAAA